MIQTGNEDLLDCLVIGAGPAGLTAATYLGRFNRSVCVAHNGDSRVRQVPKLRNCPGFPEGISGRELLERLRRQAGLYGARFVHAEIEKIDRRGEGGFAAGAGRQVLIARTVILASGVSDRKPCIPGIADAISAGTVRLCPVCDGHETAGRRVGVIGSSDHALREAVFLREFGADVVVLAEKPDASLHAAAAEKQLRLAKATGDIRPVREGMSVELADGTRSFFDIVYPALGTDVHSGLAAALGAQRDALGYVRVDSHQETSVRGLYACGDVVHALNQVAVAFGQAALAATAIHNRLRNDGQR
jgi:thioredoxin reductase (NADPH)